MNAATLVQVDWCVFMHASTTTTISNRIQFKLHLLKIKTLFQTD
jgi:hypothetical protein